MADSLHSRSLEIHSRLKDYRVEFISDWAKQCAALICDRRAFFVLDSAVNELFDMSSRLPGNRVCVLEPFESVKTMEGSRDLVERLSDAGVRRGDVIVAIGGGVIQDVVAFTASILYRGVDWIFLPTTLLAQADSCIGGKTSINVGARKNLVGNFNPPIEIYIDAAFLQTLPDIEIKSGIGEIMHYYVYADSPMLDRIVADYDAILRDRTLIQPHIYAALDIKRGVIDIDEFDQGVRNLFNYGHTFGHALESLTDFEIRHGQAVTVGMCLANRISVRLDMLHEQAATDLNALLAVNLPQYDWGNFDIGRFVELLSRDKKNVGSGTLTCILAEGRGRLVKRTIPLDDTLHQWISEFFTSELGLLRQG